MSTLVVHLINAVIGTRVFLVSVMETYAAGASLFSIVGTAALVLSTAYAIKRATETVFNNMNCQPGSSRSAAEISFVVIHSLAFSAAVLTGVGAAISLEQGILLSVKVCLIIFGFMAGPFVIVSEMVKVLQWATEQNVPAQAQQT